MSEETKNEATEVEETVVEETEKVETPTEEKVEETEKVETPTEEKTEEQPKKKINPSFFVKSEEKIDVEVEIVFDEETGEVLSVIVPELGIDLSSAVELLGYKKLKFVFTKPNYSQLNKYRNRSITYDQKAMNNVVNGIKLRDFFIIYHLKEWDVTDDNGEVMQLTFDPSGAMDDKSIDKVYTLHPTIIDVILTSFEKKMLLT